MALQNSFGRNYKRSVRENQRTFSDIAAICGVAYSTALAWQRTGVSSKHAVKVSKVLRVPAEDICHNPPQSFSPAYIAICGKKGKNKKKGGGYKKVPTVQEQVESAISVDTSSPDNSENASSSGVNLREHIATSAMTAMIDKGLLDDLGFEGIAQMARRQADSLIKELEAS